MTNLLLLTAIALLITGIIVQVIFAFRKVRIDPDPLRRGFEALEKGDMRMEAAVKEEIARNRAEATSTSRQTREELANTLLALTRTNDERIGALRDTVEHRLDTLRTAVEDKLRAVIEDNAKQLDQMRAVVDEKLQGTLERRLGESFKQVSERLEQVYRGLGEMQALATGVGDLKRVLTNVKSRGTWGEVQLGAMLEEVLTPEQFAANIATRDGGERVEYAIKLPGRSEDKEEIVWLPIDAKFPTEDYHRLLDAQDRADTEMAEGAAKDLENRIKACASEICRKYINAPRTTDFGILFLPTEGLFAEVIRRNGLTDYVQRECRVVIAGPTTLWSILNSLQLGFRTLAIQKRSSEVWNLLAAVKTEWMKYGDMLDKVQKKLNEASDTVEKARTRTRVIGRKLKDVEELPTDQAQEMLKMETDVGDPTPELEES